MKNVNSMYTMVIQFSTKKMKSFLINILMQSYGSIFYQLHIAITIPNEDQNLNIFKLFVILFGGKDVTENTFGTSIFQCPYCFLLNWLPDKNWKISSADRSLQKKIPSSLPAYDPITYCYAILNFNIWPFKWYLNCC